MNTIHAQIGAATHAALATFQAAHPGAGTLQEIIDEAVQDWLARQAPATGYRWKSLFLPAGTEVRIEYDGEATHAHVVGDRLIYSGRAVSPRQMLLDVTGLSSNAWQWLFVRRPGDPGFARASTLRARQERAVEAVTAPPSALERRLTAAVDKLERLGRAAKERRHALRRMADYERQD